LSTGANHQSLWLILSHKTDIGDSVRLKASEDGSLFIQLINDGTVVDEISISFTDKGSYWSVGSMNRLIITPLGLGLTDNEVGLAIDREGNLKTSYGASGGLVFPILWAGGSSELMSSVHERVSEEN